MMTFVRGLLLILLGASLGAGPRNAESGLILWPGTAEFTRRTDDLPISSEEAHALLVSKTRDHPGRYFDRQPIFVVGEDYLFAEPSKIDVPLQGFYLSGSSGRIEYRKSSVSIERNTKQLPPDAFTEIEVID